MEELMNILKEIDDSIDYAKECALIDDRLLDSFGVITLVSELEDAFDIDIEALLLHILGAHMDHHGIAAYVGYHGGYLRRGLYVYGHRPCH